MTFSMAGSGVYRAGLGAALMLAIAAAGVSGAKEKRRPTVSTAEDCFNDPDQVSECTGAICHCCYEDGCWICASHGTDLTEGGNPIADLDDCVWDPKARKGQKPKLPVVGVSLEVRHGRGKLSLR
jgi:hypothetical protein